MFEHLYLLRNTSVRGGDEVLDLHASCGGTAIFAAEIARSVTALDANPRALAFARFNAQLNPPRAPVAFLAGPPAEGTFDVVLAIPPFEMLPPGERRFLHSDGGPDGLDAVRACLARAQGLLSPKGRFEMIAYSPGGGGEPVLVGLLEHAFPCHRIEVHVLDVEPLDDVTRAFRKCQGYAGWRAGLRERGHDTNFFLFVRATAGHRAETVRLDPREEAAACRALAAEWA
jgi:methylase of polypeptide subunit release factors